MPRKKTNTLNAQNSGEEVVKDTGKILQLVVFKLDGEDYAANIEDVVEVVKIPEVTPLPNSPDYIAGIMNLRGQVISVIDLEKRFNLVRDNTSIRPKHIIVADFLQGSFGIIVDEVIEVIRVSESKIQLAPETVSAKIGQQYIKGVIVLEETEEKKARVHPIYLHEKEEKGKVEAKDENIASHERVLLLLDIKLILSEDEKKALTQNS